MAAAASGGGGVGENSYSVAEEVNISNYVKVNLREIRKDLSFVIDKILRGEETASEEKSTTLKHLRDLITAFSVKFPIKSKEVPSYTSDFPVPEKTLTDVINQILNKKYSTIFSP